MEIYIESDNLALEHGFSAWALLTSEAVLCIIEYLTASLASIQ